MEPLLNECALPKFLRRKQEHIMMLAWVQGQRKMLPSVSIRKSINQYLDFYNIDGDSALLEREFTRMSKELQEADKS